MIILNLPPFNLISRILFELSGGFSLFYFILAVAEILHIVYNHFNPDYDWQSHYKRVFSKKLYFPGRLGIWTIINFIIIFVLVLILPIFHI